MKLQFKRGLWLILEDEAGEATPVACDVLEQNSDRWVLEALIPPQVYPVTFVAARLRLDGQHVGMVWLDPPILTRTHQPEDLHLEIPIAHGALAAAGWKT